MDDMNQQQRESLLAATLPTVSPVLVIKYQKAFNLKLFVDSINSQSSKYFISGSFSLQYLQSVESVAWLREY